MEPWTARRRRSPIGNQDIAPVANAGAGQKWPSEHWCRSMEPARRTATTIVDLLRGRILSAPAESQATLTSATAPNPAFTADKYGNYVVQLIVNDGYLTVSHLQCDLDDLHRAGCESGAGAERDGRRNGEPVGSGINQQRWLLADLSSGPCCPMPAAPLRCCQAPSSVTPTFVADVVGAYVAQLIVNDTVTNSTPPDVMITAIAPNQPPVVMLDRIKRPTFPAPSRCRAQPRMMVCLSAQP